MRTCISMISGSGFACKAELGAGGVHLLRLLRRLLRHQPTAVHWESVQGESYVVRFPDPLKSVGESDKEPCSCTSNWQRGYYPVRTTIDFHLLARVRSSKRNYAPLQCTAGPWKPSCLSFLLWGSLLQTNHLGSNLLGDADLFDNFSSLLNFVWILSILSSKRHELAVSFTWEGWS